MNYEQIYGKITIDIISHPMLESFENLLNQSQINSAQGRTILAKKRQLNDWKNVFYRDGQAQISSLIIKIRSDLNSEIAAFAEEHFSDKNADRAWNRVLKDRRIELICQELLDGLEMRANDKLGEISREITNEVKFAASFASDKALKMDKIIDGKKLWNWSSVIVGGGLSVAASIAYLVGSVAAGPLGWAALAVTGIGILGSFLFKSREKKEFEARTRLEKSLRDNVTKICDSLQTQMKKNLDSLISIRIEGLMREMDKINSVIFRLADTQSNRQNIRSQFNVVANELEDFARQYVKDNVIRPLEVSISTIDRNIQEIRDSRHNRSILCRNMEELQQECRFLIQDIHSTNLEQEER